MNHGIDLELVSDLKRREDAHFVDKHPKSLALGERGRTTMPLGVPLSWMAFLYDHPPLFVHFIIQNGRLGVSSGEGFYRYPDPAFDEPGFI